MKKTWLIPLASIMATIVLGITINQMSSLNSFNSGELSPLMDSRVDYPGYSTGARQLQNMIVRSQGPIERRPGTRFIAQVKDSNDYTRIIPFEYSTSDSYIIELGDEYARFFRAATAVLEDDVNVYEVNTPWDANDIFELQFAQDSQYMRFVHPDYQPYKLIRTDHNDWTCEAIDFENGPFLDENTDTTSTITPSATTGDITLTATGGIFNSEHVGALWQLRNFVDSNIVSEFWSQTLATDQNSLNIDVFKGQDFKATTGGTWYGILYVQRSTDNGVTWETVGEPFYSHYSDNLVYYGTETEDDALYRLHWHTLEVYNGRWDKYGLEYTLTSIGFWKKGIVSITAYSDANDVNATVETELGGTETTYKWSEGAWSDYRGWPRTVEYHQQRCVYGGNASYPQTVWASVIAYDDNDYDDFDVGEGNADEAWTYILPGMNPIQWLKSAEYLMIGTTSSVIRMGKENEAITPTETPPVQVQAKNGCEYMQPMAAQDAILFVERGAQKVRELTYTYASNRYIAPDMTILSEHITGDGIVEIDFQRRTDPILWCIREDGVLLSFTYERKHDVLAWARHITGQDPNDMNDWDEIESVAVIPGTSTKANGDSRIDDEVWWVVNRTMADGNDYRTVEQMQCIDWGTDPNYCWFVDCAGEGLTSTGTAETPAVEEVNETYRWTYVSDVSKFYGIPLGDVNGYTSISAGDANNIGGGIVGIPYENSPFVEGMTIRIESTTHYDGNYILGAQSDPNEIQVTATYQAETFAGTEYAYLYYNHGLNTYGRIAIDPNRYLLVGSTWENDTFIQKFDVNDGSYAAADVDFGSFQAGGGSIYGMEFNGTDLYVKLAWGSGYLIKFDYTTGDIDWSAGCAGYDMSVDSDGNAYGFNGGILYKYDNADGSSNSMTGMGQKNHAKVWNSDGYDVHVDDTLGIVIWAGYQRWFADEIVDANDYMYNLAVSNLAGTEYDQLIVGDLSEYLYGPTLVASTPRLDVDFVTSDGNAIYVLAPDSDGNRDLFKYSWSSGTLTEECNSLTINATSADGLFIDLWGNLVVIDCNQVTTSFYYYDTNDLSEIGTQDNYYGDIASTWSSVGSIYIQGKALADGVLGVTGSGASGGTRIWSIGDCNLLTDREVCLYADAIPRGTYDMTDELVEDWNDTYTVIIAGINYYSIYESMPLASIFQQGSSQGRHTNLKDALISYYDTMGSHVGVSMDQSADIKFNYDDWATTIDPYTGWKGPFPLLRGNTQDPTIYIWEWDPLPMGIRSIHINKEVTLE